MSADALQHQINAAPDGAHDRLAQAAAQQNPELASAFDDGGWILVRVHDALMTLRGLPFAPGDLALARPAVGRHTHDFIVYSLRIAGFVGLRFDQHFAFAD
jgi:hypothetical protein